jgi:hypothetical protein
MAGNLWPVKPPDYWLLDQAPPSVESGAGPTQAWNYLMKRISEYFGSGQR